MKTISFQVDDFLFDAMKFIADCAVSPEPVPFDIFCREVFSRGIMGKFPPDMVKFISSIFREPDLNKRVVLVEETRKMFKHVQDLSTGKEKPDNMYACKACGAHFSVVHVNGTTGGLDECPICGANSSAIEEAHTSSVSFDAGAPTKGKIVSLEEVLKKGKFDQPFTI
jgi:hypothetical protein